MSHTILNDLEMNILEKEPKSKIKNPLHTKDLLKFKITGQNGAQWFLIRSRLLLDSIQGPGIHVTESVGPRTKLRKSLNVEKTY